MLGYCPNCQQEGDLSPFKKFEELSIRSERILVSTEGLKCPYCGEEFEDPKSDYDPLVVAYADYRRRKNMVTPEEIQIFRKTYGLTQKELSDLSGIGIASLSRYENGALQEEAHDKLLKFVMVPRNFLGLIENDQDALSEIKRANLIKTLRGELAGIKSNLDIFIDLYGSYDSDNLCGYRKIDPYRLLDMTLFFCYPEGVYMTKLNKLLFYADYKHFKTNTVSISGCPYAHAPHGPVPNNYRHYFAFISDGEASPVIIKEEEMYDYTGDIIIARRAPDLTSFSYSELLVLKEVKEFFKSFSAKQIRLFSHEEEAYKSTTNGELMDYLKASSLKI